MHPPITNINALGMIKFANAEMCATGINDTQQYRPVAIIKAIIIAPNAIFAIGEAHVHTQCNCAVIDFDVIGQSFRGKTKKRIAHHKINLLDDLIVQLE